VGAEDFGSVAAVQWVPVLRAGAGAEIGGECVDRREALRLVWFRGRLRNLEFL
jgi:hypothetical protein